MTATYIRKPMKNHNNIIYGWIYNKIDHRLVYELKDYGNKIMGFDVTGDLDYRVTEEIPESKGVFDMAVETYDVFESVEQALEWMYLV